MVEEVSFDLIENFDFAGENLDLFFALDNPSLDTDKDDDLLILEDLTESWSDSEAVDVILDFLLLPAADFCSREVDLVMFFLNLLSRSSDVVFARCAKDSEGIFPDFCVIGIVFLAAVDLFVLFDVNDELLVLITEVVLFALAILVFDVDLLLAKLVDKDEFLEFVVDPFETLEDIG